MNTSDLPYNITRDNGGKGAISIKSRVDLGFDHRRLILETSKNVFRPGIRCIARVVEVDTASGHEISTMAISKFGARPFTRVVSELESARATEKTLTAMHCKGLEQLQDLVAAAIAHYQPQEKAVAA